MGFKKCPRCELNYIKDEEKYCNVCKREMKGEADSEHEVAICTECGENPVVKGLEICAMCLREVRRQEIIAEQPVEMRSADGLSISVELDEIEVPMPAEGEIPESELDEIHKELGGDYDDLMQDESEEAADEIDEDDALKDD